MNEYASNIICMKKYIYSLSLSVKSAKIIMLFFEQIRSMFSSIQINALQEVINNKNYNRYHINISIRTYKYSI